MQLKPNEAYSNLTWQKRGLPTLAYFINFQRNIRSTQFLVECDILYRTTSAPLGYCPHFYVLRAEVLRRRSSPTQAKLNEKFPKILFRRGTYMGYHFLRLFFPAHGENDFVASTKRFVNIASANQNC